MTQEIDLQTLQIYLDELERQKVKKLQEKILRAPFLRERLLFEKEILKILQSALAKAEKTSSNSKREWLQDADKEKIVGLKARMASAKSFREAVFCEASIYRIYHARIASYMDFPFQQEVEKYIGMLEECETQREAAILSTVIHDLHQEAIKSLW